ncbi:ABC transporter ATP-binding protein [Ferrovibrio sp.]|uniref:ABC transporter ATP-binding protein n=1 Tax=Ferrovibrio sp. TaxID=1917215 RepID=UPI00312044CE
MRTDTDSIARDVAAVPLLETHGLVKRFGALVANDHIDLAVRPGEIHALLGENGAGKSTLVKMLYGLLQPDAGQILWQGDPAPAAEPRAARQRGIGMVFQHFSLFEAMTVAENVALGLDDAPRDARVLAKRIRDVSAAYGLPLDPARYVHDLSVGERQRIEIVRCLLQAPRLLIMDEPTSVLTPQEVDRLFATLRQLAAEGCAILYISHKLEEIRSLCDRATILRGGRVVAACDPQAETARSLAALMVGSEFRTAERRAAGAGGDAGADAGAPRLEVAGLSLAAEAAHGVGIADVSFAVAAGEILGIAGVAGNGQGELLAALAGERLSDTAASLRINGEPAGRLGPSRRRRLGLGIVPEERNGHGAVPELSLADNVLLTARDRLGMVARGFLDRPAARRYAEKVIAAFGVRCKGPEAPAGSLSGGNLQKFIIGREILQEPDVLVVAQPTWGIDAAAVATVQQALLDLAARGCAVVVISQDLDELLALSDRIAVIHGGRLSAPRPTVSLTVDEIGLLMGGASVAAVH